MSCTTDFKARCDPPISNLDLDGIIGANMLVATAIKVNRKYPLLFLPDFVEDLVNGTYSRKMMNKYHIHTYNDFNIMTSSTLKFSGRRSKGHDDDCKEKNLAIRGWKQQYHLLISQFRLFRPQLVDMLNCSVLRALVAHAVLKLQYIPYNSIESSVLESYSSLKTRFHIPEDVAFEDYIGDGLARKIDSIITRMARVSLLTSIEGDVSVPAKYADMRIWIRDMIEKNKGSMQYQSLVTKVLGEFPLLRMLPSRDEIDGALDRLERDGNIICKRTFWKFAPYSNLLFSPDFYKASIDAMKAQAVLLGRTKFFGRRITPDQFIAELQILESGDLGDQDDQVTRIAGLVLSDAVLLQSPAEHVPEFDFVMDFTNYSFRPKHVDMMRKIDFEVRSNIFHCKVMINDEITASRIDKLRRIVPAGEQGVVFTCSPVNVDIKRQTRDDRVIQIIDKNGILAWCSITSTMPCRLNSTARVMYGDNRGKAVMVKSANYESGMTTVEVAPDHKEITLPIGCLEEIGPATADLTDADPKDLGCNPKMVTCTEDYVAASEEYFEFLCDLASLAENSFEDGLVLNVRAVHMTRLDLMKSIKPEMFGGPHPDVEVLDESQYARYVEFKNGIYSTVNIRPNETSKSFACECYHKLNETYRFTLCSHLVAAIVQLGLKEPSDWESAKSQIRAFKRELYTFRMENVTRVVLALRDVIGGNSEQLLIEYVRSHMPNDGNDREESQNVTNGTSLDAIKKYISDSLENDFGILELLTTLETDLMRLDDISLRQIIRALHEHYTIWGKFVK